MNMAHTLPRFDHECTTRPEDGFPEPEYPHGYCEECGEEHPDLEAEHARLLAAFRAAGFVVEGTGGGFEALVKYEADRVVVVTGDGDDEAMIPAHLGTPTVVGYYTREAWEECGGPYDDDGGTAAHVLARFA